MNNTIYLIQILDAIERNGSFEAAANELHKVRSALTYTISQSEEMLGITLFDRSKQKAKLTEAGRALLEQGRYLLTMLQQMEEKVKQIATGWEAVIRIAYDVIISMDPFYELIKRFQKNCPETNLEIYSEVLGGSTDALMNNRVDIAMGFPAPLPSHSDLVFEPMGQTNFVFAIPPSHPLAKIKEPLPLETIKQYYSIAARDSSRQAIPLSSMLLSNQRRITFSNLNLKKEAQIKGLGVGFLPLNLIKADIKFGRLIIKDVATSNPLSNVYIGWNKTRKGKATEWLLNEIRNKKFQKKLLA